VQFVQVVEVLVITTVVMDGFKRLFLRGTGAYKKAKEKGQENLAPA
jgi:hypothetical protein